ncbi:MAG: thioredoxin family protein [Burkholderiaceae bacterium]|nr:thioredoxin family protein [Burkholderiaceae bacterium]
MTARRLALVFAALLLSALGALRPALAANATVVTSERVRAELLAHAPQGVEPGQPVWVGLSLTHQPEWHTYWKNSGDSGLPTSMEWTLPPGVMAGDIAWPVPRKIPIGTLANYGYEDRVLLAVPLIVTPDFKPSVLKPELEVKLRASWLVCRKECIPEDGEFTLRLPTHLSTAINGADFEAALASQPQALPAGSTVTVDGQMLKVTAAGLPARLQGRELEFFPEVPEVIETAGTWRQAWQGATWTAEVPLSPMRSQSPAQLPFVVALKDAHDRVGWRADAAVAGTWPQAAAPAAVPAALAEALAQNAAPGGNKAALPLPSLSLWAALVGALLGGLILNLMPCVFPVLALKVAGFAHHADDAPARRSGGLAYAAGVVLSFIVLGALVLALRATGEQLGWGFQLQSPAVVAALAALFTVIGLNFAGVFEFGGLLPSRLATLRARRPTVDSFLTGVLAVAVASPCTAPFMGASIGLAIGLPAPVALAIFAAVGVGMALPYLAACWVPAVARALPRPGPWMDTFRRLMAFPMFATVAWLVWVLGQQSGIDGAGALLALLVALAALVWALTLRGRTRAVMVAALALVAVALLGTLGPAVTRLADPAATAASGERWQAWTPGKVDQLLAAGQPVFVDFTAAWCVTCQYNKKTTLSDDAVLADFDRRNVALLRADWTRRDPAITAALAALGRNGVPVYVLHAPGRAPQVLTEVLGAGELRAALNAL